MVLGYRNAVDAHVVTERFQAVHPWRRRGSQRVRGRAVHPRGDPKRGLPTDYRRRVARRRARDPAAATDGRRLLRLRAACARVRRVASSGRRRGVRRDASALGILFLSPSRCRPSRRKRDGTTEHGASEVQRPVPRAATRCSGNPDLRVVMKCSSCAAWLDTDSARPALPMPRWLSPRRSAARVRLVLPRHRRGIEDPLVTRRGRHAGTLELGKMADGP